MNSPSFLNSLDYLTLNAIQRLIACAVHDKKNLIVSGGSQTGKTHLTSVLGRIFRTLTILRACDVEEEFRPKPSLFSLFGSKITPVECWTDDELDALTRHQGFLIDHVSSLHPDELDRIDLLLQKAHKNTLPFGGIQIVLLGDFCKLPPVLRSQTAAYAFKAKSVTNADFHVFTLTEYYHRKSSEWEDAFKVIRLADAAHKKAPQKLIDAVNFMHDFYECNDKNKAALNCCQHAHVREKLNAQFISTSPGRAFNYAASSKGDWEFAAPILTIKVGTQVMFTRDIPEYGIFRGMLATVTHPSKKSILVTTEYGHDIDVPLMTWLNKKPHKDRGGVRLLTVGERVMYPLVEAYAVLPHQIQGRRSTHNHIHSTNKVSLSFLYEMLTSSDVLSGWPTYSQTIGATHNSTGICFSILHGIAEQGVLLKTDQR